MKGRAENIHVVAGGTLSGERPAWCQGTSKVVAGDFRSCSFYCDGNTFSDFSHPLKYSAILSMFRNGLDTSTYL